MAALSLGGPNDQAMIARNHGHRVEAFHLVAPGLSRPHGVRGHFFAVACVRGMLDRGARAPLAAGWPTATWRRSSMRRRHSAPPGSRP
jgi:hypothetical protein